MKMREHGGPCDLPPWEGRAKAQAHPTPAAKPPLPVLRPPAPAWAWPGQVSSWRGIWRCGLRVVLYSFNSSDSTLPGITHFTKVLKELSFEPNVRPHLREAQGGAVMRAEQGIRTSGLKVPPLPQSRPVSTVVGWWPLVPFSPGTCGSELGAAWYFYTIRT